MSFERLILLGPMLRPWCGITLVLAGSRILLAAAGWYCRRCGASAEGARKLLHIGMGTIFLACPWLFDRAWPVLLLAAVFVGLLIARWYCAPLQYHVAGVIYGVRRQSRGEYYFPLSAAALFILAGGDALLYCIPLALLVYADAAAAIIGTRYGSRRFAGLGGKTLEGCAAFAVTAFFTIHVPLVLAGRVSPAASLLIAAGVSLMGTLVEALCSSGLDNIAVPLLTFAMFRGLLGVGPGALLVHFAGVLAVVAIAIGILSFTTGSATRSDAV